MSSEEDLRAGAVACFTNAQELYGEARLLFERAYFSRLAALERERGSEYAAFSHTNVYRAHTTKTEGPSHTGP